MKGIILAGGSGTRLYPSTIATSKQLLSVYDKPMIYYPLSVLMLGGIKEILIISTPRDIENFKNLFLDGKHLGLSIKYATQDEPKGIAQAITIGRDFIKNDNVCLILGDNIFYGDGLTEIILKSIDRTKENLASIFAFQVKDPRRYGVVEISDESKVVSLEEKPKTPKTNLAATGIYFYPNDVIEKVNDVIPSQRGELEITDLNKLYLKENRLIAEKLLRGFTWIDTGTHDSMLDSSNFICSIQKRNGSKIACIEEIAFNKGLIDENQLLELSRLYKNNEYGLYLKKLISKN
jgi:glucose-1-phosphate thymidylyltransferase